MFLNQTLDKDTSEDAIAELVDSIKHSPEYSNFLVELLPERNPLYKGRGTNESIRIRGYILAAFEQSGLPDAAMPFVLEELENGREAYLVAAAAKAVRGLAKPTDSIIPFLFKAIENIKYIDDAVTFEIYKPRWPNPNFTTALTEIFKTFGWLGIQAKQVLPELETQYGNSHDFSTAVRTEIKNAIENIKSQQEERGSCCSSTPINLSFSKKDTWYEHKVISLPANARLEDQIGQTLTYREFFNSVPAIVVFFYTRCNNPNKCSLTITKLARLQKVVRQEGLDTKLKTAAITYDPEYDLPPRLKAYGENRDVLFDNNNRFFRVSAGFQQIQEYFKLGVNFNNTIVNQHRIELFILDDKGKIISTFSRLQWDIYEVIQRAVKMMK